MNVLIGRFDKLKDVSLALSLVDVVLVRRRPTSVAVPAKAMPTTHQLAILRELLVGLEQGFPTAISSFLSSCPKDVLISSQLRKKYFTRFCCLLEKFDLSPLADCDCFNWTIHQAERRFFCSLIG